MLASKYLTEAAQTRRSMRIVEAAWLAHPHPDLADAYAHVKLGDSARQRLARIEALAAKAPEHIESALAIARAAIDASEFPRARAALAPFLDVPTQRVAMLMAEIERTEHGDSGRARAWMLRAVRALRDPVWTADGYVSDSWRPLSPVTGQLDAFQWKTPLAALPSDKTPTIEADFFDEPLLMPQAEPPVVDAPEPAQAAPIAATQDNSPASTPADAEQVNEAPPPAAPAEMPAPATPSEPATPSPTPLFPPRTAAVRAATSGGAPVFPIVRAPDDPGIDDETPGGEFAERADSTQAQTSGWRGFLSRWGA